MADIAILVAEEYERRVKQTNKGSMQIDSSKTLSVLRKKMKKRFGEERIENFIKKLEAKSQMGLAASNGFFSA